MPFRITIVDDPRSDEPGEYVWNVGTDHFSNKEIEEIIREVGTAIVEAYHNEVDNYNADPEGMDPRGDMPIVVSMYKMDVLNKETLSAIWGIPHAPDTWESFEHDLRYFADKFSEVFGAQDYEYTIKPKKNYGKADKEALKQRLEDIFDEVISPDDETD